MRNLTFYGGSDDLFEIEGTRQSEPDEIGCYSTGELSHAVVTVGTPDGKGLQVIGAYAANGVWFVGLAPLDEDLPMPDWGIHYTFVGYSARLSIDVPDDAVVSRIRNVE